MLCAGVTCSNVDVKSKEEKFALLCIAFLKIARAINIMLSVLFSGDGNTGEMIFWFHIHIGENMTNYF